MIGFRVSLVDGSAVTIEADAYAVDTTGTLTMCGGGATVQTFPGGEWVMVADIGKRLVDEWPPHDLDVLVDSVAVILAVRFGHYVHRLRQMALDGEWRLDLDALTSRLLQAVGLDAVDTSSRAEFDAVRVAIALHSHRAE